jgi:hypothetical protein
MHESRFGCAVVAHHGRIFVSGGFGQDKAILSTLESYDPDTDRWSRLRGVLVDRPVHFEAETDA